MPKKFLATLLRSVGGQGGDTLKELLTHAFHHEGFIASSWSKVGLAQRGGSVETYIEASREPIVFCPHPSPGFVDLALGLELFEAFSMVEGGFISRSRTYTLVNTSRVYMAQEKMLPKDGAPDPKKILDALNSSSKFFFAINASAICQVFRFDSRAQNIVLFAALPEFPELGISERACIYAIRELGKNVEENLKVFEAARRLISSGEYKNYQDSVEFDSLGTISQKAREKIDADAAGSEILQNSALSFKNLEIKLVYCEATGRIWNFQHSCNYVSLYRKRVEGAARLLLKHEDFDENKAAQILIKTMRYLANMMVYHDAPYVAKLKTRRDRFEWIQKEIDCKENEIYSVTESFAPDIMEIFGLLPKKFVDFLAAMPIVGKYVREGTASLPIKMRTDTISGFFMVWLLRVFEPFRLYSWRYARENAYIEMYLEALKRGAHFPFNAIEAIADSPNIIKGYGKTRTNSFSDFEKKLSEIVQK